MHRQKPTSDGSRICLLHTHKYNEMNKKKHQQPNAVLQVDRFTEVKPKKNNGNSNNNDIAKRKSASTRPVYSWCENYFIKHFNIRQKKKKKEIK